ncbi:MAG: C39 family peptidase [Spirochaetia bacterium]|nr:C39 family peptidase [Spirochaetia bacterium]
MSKKTFYILIFCVVFYIIFIQIRIYALSDDISDVIESQKNKTIKILLNEFPIVKQAKPYSCGLATITMIYSFLVEKSSEETITKKLELEQRKSGMTPRFFSENLQSLLKDYRVTYFSNIKDSLVLKNIFHSLDNQIPVGINFSTINAFEKQSTDTHLSAIIGYDLNSNTFIVANAYGFIEEIKISSLFRMLKYENHKDSPFLFDLAILLNIIGKNNIIIIEPL